MVLGRGGSARRRGSGRAAVFAVAAHGSEPGRRAALELVEPALERIGQPGLEERIAIELEAGRSVLGAREAARNCAKGGFAHDRSPFAAGARSSSSSASSASARAPRSLGAYSNTESPFDCASSIRT